MSKKRRIIRFNGRFRGLSAG